MTREQAEQLQSQSGGKLYWDTKNGWGVIRPGSNTPVYTSGATTATTGTTTLNTGSLIQPVRPEGMTAPTPWNLPPLPAVPPPSTGGQVSYEDIFGGGGTPPAEPPPGGGGGGQPFEWPSYLPPTTDPGPGRAWVYVDEVGWVSAPSSAGAQQGSGALSARDIEEIDIARNKFNFERTQFDQQQAAERERALWNQQFQQSQLDAQKQGQQAQIEAERQQRLASLAANPKSWLEYASLSGTNPAIQPWMMPLMSQEYSQLKPGEQLPNWNATDMTKIPELTTPSRQYWSRMGPTGQAQYAGYEQARTGAPAEEQDFRLWNQAPPGGGYGGGLRWAR